MVVFYIFRNLVDQPHDNMLDPNEFTLAMHLVCRQLLQQPLPDVLPKERLSGRQEAIVAQMTYKEFKSYRALFEALDLNRRGFLDG